MAKSLRIILSVLGLALLVSGAAVSNSMTVPPVAGQHPDAGEADVTNDDGKVLFQVWTENGLCLLVGHALVGETAPWKSAPGRVPFPFDTCDAVISPNDPCAEFFTFVA